MQITVSFLVFILNDAFLGICCIIDKSTKNQMSKYGFVWTNNENMIWATNDKEFTLGLLKGKHKSSHVKGVNMLQVKGTANTQVLQLKAYSEFSRK